MGITDTGLCKLSRDIQFQNKCLEIDATAKSLLPSDEVEFGDIFQIDSVITGIQQLGSLGVRVMIPGVREKDLIGKLEDLPGPSTYVTMVQGVYAMSAPEISAKPRIREGVCGSALVRTRRADNETVLEQGSDFDYTIRHRPGKNNIISIADGLSRLPEILIYRYKPMNREPLLTLPEPDNYKNPPLETMPVLPETDKVLHPVGNIIIEENNIPSTRL